MSSTRRLVRLIDRMLQNEAGLTRAIEQADTLVSWSEAHDLSAVFHG